MHLVFALFMTTLSVPSFAAEKACERWFTDAKLQKGPGCLLKCASTSVDMGSFQCPDQCDDLCSISSEEKVFFKISDLYPGLTAAEKAITSAEPSKSLKAYFLSWKAEQICHKPFPTSRSNDESDGCRHFVWAALMSKELGEEFTEKILNAHEQEPRQPENEKAMDLANNRRGISVGRKLEKDKNFNEENLMTAFKEDLNQGRIIVLKKRVKAGGKP